MTQALPIRGYLDAADFSVVSGWAFDPNAPERVLTISIYDGDQLLARIPAGDYRADLVSAGVGNGRHAFRLRLPDGVLPHSRHLIRARVDDEGFDLPGSPKIVLRQGGRLDAAARDWLESLVGSEITLSTTSQDLAPVTGFLVSLLDRILEARIERGVRVEPGDLRRQALTPDFRALLDRMQQTYPFLDAMPCARPSVSLICYAAQSFHELYGLVRCILDSPPMVPFELVVVDDCLTDETMLARTVLGRNVRLTRTTSRVGRIGAAKAGAALARAPVLLFLDARVRLLSGSIDALVRAIESHPKAAAVGAKFVSRAGRVLNMGFDLSPLGDVTAVARGAQADEPMAMSPRDVDYVSSRCLATTRQAWSRVGGFSDAFQPEGFEDADFCFRARQAGYRVLATGHAVDVSGTDEVASEPDPWNGSTNRRLLLDTWKAALGEARTRQVQKPQLLFVDVDFPEPDRDAGSIVAVEHMQSLRRIGYDVTYMPGRPIGRKDPAAERLETLGVKCNYMPYVSDFPTALAYNLAPFDVVFFHRYQNASMHLSEVRTHAPQARIVVSVADLHHLREARHVAISPDTTNPAKALEVREQELSVLAKADVVLVHSPAEAQILRQEIADLRIHVVPWAVSLRPRQRPFSEADGVLFVGNPLHAPNEDAVSRLRSVIVPGVRARAAVPFSIVGDWPSEPSYEEAGIRVLGHVASLAPGFEAVRLSIAPLRFGAGIKGKVLESMAHGVPCVMSEIAAEGLHLTGNLATLICRDEASMIELVLSLHEDLDRLEALSRDCLDFIACEFSQRVQDDRMGEALTFTKAAAASGGHA